MYTLFKMLNVKHLLLFVHANQ